MAFDGIPWFLPYQIPWFLIETLCQSKAREDLEAVWTPRCAGQASRTVRPKPWRIRELGMIPYMNGGLKSWEKAKKTMDLRSEDLLSRVDVVDVPGNPRH